MISRTRSELVRDIFVQKLLVQVAVHFVEEISLSAVNSDVETARCEKMYHVDDSILFHFSGKGRLSTPPERQPTELNTS